MTHHSNDSCLAAQSRAFPADMRSDNRVDPRLPPAVYPFHASAMFAKLCLKNNNIRMSEWLLLNAQ